MADEASTSGTSSSQVAGVSPESTVEINIKTLDSKIYTFWVDKDMPVSALKEKLVDVTGVPVERQRLIFRGKVLKDSHLLSEHHLEDGHTLHLVARQPVEGQVPAGTGSEGTSQDNVSQGKLAGKRKKKGVTFRSELQRFDSNDSPKTTAFLLLQ